MSESTYGDEHCIEPLGSPPAWRQLGVLVLDGSPSMTESAEMPELPPGIPTPTKAQAVDNAVRDLLNLLKVGRAASNFSFAFIDFHDEIAGRFPEPNGQQEPMIDLTALDVDQAFDPTRNGTGNGTRIEAGLAAAAEVVRAFVSGARDDGLPRSAVVLLMSDGETADPASAHTAAEALKALPNTLLACALFSTRGRPAPGGPFLQAIASDNPSTGRRMYETVYSAVQLRDFFHRSLLSVAPAAAASGGPA